MATPTAEEQLLLEYINAARIDPVGDAAHYIASYAATATSADSDINQALRFFGVSGPALLSALQALTPVAPLAWNEQLANAAQSHDGAMIAADSQTHQAPGEPDLGARFLAAGYNYQAGGENVYAFATSPLDAHAGFMVDWGNGPNGMQSPPGHRDNLLDADFREVGVAIVHETNSATQVGPEVVTEDLGARSASGAFILGVAYADSDHNDFYSLGEGLGGLQVSVGGTSASGYATGGYSLQTALTGAQTVTYSGASLASPVSVTVNLAAGANIKIDLVSGTELKTSASAAVSGPISLIEALGTKGLALAATGSAFHDIEGGAGGDVITGGSGSNYLRGGAGDDRVNGGPGFDDINGNQGNDTASGGDGQDWVVGGKDNDSLSGGADFDVLNGNLGDDTVSGDGGNDVVRGGQGNDLVLGGLGDDFVSGDKGDDTMTGGPGADFFHTFGDTGTDRVTDFNRAEGDSVWVDAGTTWSVGQVGADTVISLSGGGTMTLLNVQASSLSGDWIFSR